MMNNKILTVSYGTFSCTLEGFDDSFGTMKAIAEYFRDLASDDRYFGAEPPVPDAEMLARIAQREVSRKVQAHERDGTIVLSTLESQQKDAPAGTVITSAVPTLADVEDSASVDVAEPKAEETPAESSVEAISEETVEEYVTNGETAITDVPDVIPGQPDAEVQAFFDDTIPDAGEPAVTADPEGIAAKLERIRAVVSNNTDTSDTGAYAEDQHAEADTNADALDEAPAISDTLADLAFEEDESAAEITTNPVEFYNDEATEDDAPSSEPTQMSEEDEADDVEETASDDDVDAILERLAAATASDDDLSDLNDEVASGEDSDNLFEDTLAAGSDGEKELVEDLDRQAEDAPEAEAEGTNARLLKVKRDALEAALMTGAVEEYDAEDDVEEAPKRLDAIAPSRSKSTSLSAEAEQDLVRELESLEQDIATDDNHDEAEETPIVDGVMTLRAVDRTDQPTEVETDRDTDVNRLLAEADQQMDEPESATRRDAFTHLRAAVASQKAEVALGNDTQEDSGVDAYRDDLAQVVRPRRPAAGATGRHARPKEGTAAPLTLVAEQRVDIGKDTAKSNVLPRRVTATTEVEPLDASGESFAAFAEDMGAVTLSEQLEAAASYMSFVEGRDQFSRPQLMTKVRQSGGQTEFSREDGLRSFGQLLRAGKISKIKGGRFTVSEHIGFKPDQRAAG